MASNMRRSRGHGRSRRKIDIFSVDGYRFRAVNGFQIRNVFPDFDILECYSTTGDRHGGMPTPFIPREDGFWIDRRFRKEARFLLEVYLFEKRHPSWTYQKLRGYLKAKFTKRGPVPKFVVRREKLGSLTIKYVRGDVVRQYLDPHFIFGGHGLVYPDNIPKDEVWIDIRQDPREIPYTLFHELYERRLMSRKQSYAKAHAQASEAERHRRHRELKAPQRQPLRVKPFEQSSGLCGPASLKMLLGYFGRDYEESYLTHLAGATPETGADHIQLVKSAGVLGATVFEKAGGSIRELRRFVLKERLPVMIGWWSGPERTREEVVADPSLDEGHYSVVYHLTAKHVFLMDPELKKGTRRMTVKEFLAAWWDLDTPEYLRVDRWYAVLNFEGRKFNIRGGVNH